MILWHFHKCFLVYHHSSPEKQKDEGAKTHQSLGWYWDPGFLIIHPGSYHSLCGGLQFRSETLSHAWGTPGRYADLQFLSPVAGPRGSVVSSRGLSNSSKLITRVSSYIASLK